MSSFEQKLYKPAFPKIVEMAEQIDDKPTTMLAVDRDKFAEELVHDALREGYSPIKLLHAIDMYLEMCSHSVRVVAKTGVVNDQLLLTRKNFCLHVSKALIRFVRQEKNDAARAAAVNARVEASLKAAAVGERTSIATVVANQPVSVLEDKMDIEFVFVKKHNGKSETGSDDDGWEMPLDGAGRMEAAEFAVRLLHGKAVFGPYTFKKDREFDPARAETLKSIVKTWIAINEHVCENARLEKDTEAFNKVLERLYFAHNIQLAAKAALSPVNGGSSSRTAIDDDLS
ncbi:hypothetical protein B0T20DRAFT_484206 [Sordaria brevicollis]|uniref:Uncharacterized protein n=1 Tax=Sordaria brevicollis TaxID=83679 RepID=A0AAE0NVM6_SORBR|nr:hypothetical protein B0T20DRAFT_484206 [Sordaria brevicollis]